MENKKSLACQHCHSLSLAYLPGIPSIRFAIFGKFPAATAEIYSARVTDGAFK